MGAAEPPTDDPLWLSYSSGMDPPLDFDVQFKPFMEDRRVFSTT